MGQVARLSQHLSIDLVANRKMINAQTPMAFYSLDFLFISFSSSLFSRFFYSTHNISLWRQKKD